MTKTKKFLCVVLLLTVAVITFGFSNSLLRNTNLTANAATESVVLVEEGEKQPGG